MANTAADFDGYSFARKGDRWAFRVDPEDKGLPWAYGEGNGTFWNWGSDHTLARDGWEPLDHGAAFRALAEPRKMTAREHLVAAWEAAEVPADGKAREGESTLYRDRNGRFHLTESWAFAPSGDGYRLLDPRPTRPEGADALDDKINAAVRGLDLTTKQGRRALADALATEGVRAAA